MATPAPAPSCSPSPSPSASGHARLVDWLIAEIERPQKEVRALEPSEGRAGMWVLDYHVREVQAGGDCSCDGRALPLFEAHDLQRLSARWRLNVFSLFKQWGRALPSTVISPERQAREARPSYYAFMGKPEPPPELEDDPEDVEWCQRLRLRIKEAIEAAYAIGPIVQPQPQQQQQQQHQRQRQQEAAEQMSDVGVAQPAQAQTQSTSQAAAGSVMPIAAAPVAPAQPRRSPQPPSQQQQLQQPQWQQQQQQQRQQQQRPPSVEEHKSHQQKQRQT